MDVKHLRVLVVDDMNMMRKLILRHLQLVGFTNFEEAEDGDEAWAKLEATANGAPVFHLVICDWAMPGANGLEVLRRVRAHPQLKDLAFVMVTAEAEGPHVVEAARAGVSGYIIKPFTQEILIGKVMSALQKYGLVDQASA